jgi:hypothetical protein
VNFVSRELFQIDSTIQEANKKLKEERTKKQSSFNELEKRYFGPESEDEDGHQNSAGT